MAKYDELMKEYKKLAKRADQRLVRLERLSQEDHYHGVTSYSYKRAMSDIRKYSGEDATRFNTKAPTSISALKAKIKDIETFLEAPTSTKSQITKIYKKRAKTVNAEYGTNFSWQDLANYYESAESKKLESMYGSKTLIKALGGIKKLGNEADDIKSAIDGNVKVVEGDEIANEISKNLLKQGLTSDRLFKN